MFHLDVGFHLFFAFAYSSRQPCSFSCQLSFGFHFFIYMFMLSNMFIFPLAFGFVFPVHCVLVLRYSILCLFAVCVYNSIQIVSFAKSTASFFQDILDEEQSAHC